MNYKLAIVLSFVFIGLINLVVCVYRYLDNDEDVFGEVCWTISAILWSLSSMH